MGASLLPKESGIDILIQQEENKLRRLEDESTRTRININNLIRKKIEQRCETSGQSFGPRKKLTWNEFKALKELESGDTLDIGHVVMVDDGESSGKYESKTFVRAVADSYCGNDFSGYIEETGRRIGWRKNVDLYKIIGRDISIKKPA